MGEIEKHSHNPEHRQALGKTVMRFGKYSNPPLMLAEIAEKDWQYIEHMAGQFAKERPFISTFKRAFVEFYELSRHLHEKD